MLQEAPSIFFFLWAFLNFTDFGNIKEILGKREQIISLIGFLLFQFHYIHRTFIYTLIRAHSISPSSLIVVLFASLFTSSNGYLNAVFIKYETMRYETLEYNSFFNNFLKIFGLILFFTGFYINYSSDTILINLRKKRDEKEEDKEKSGKRKYKIPYGGMYHYLTCPNYFGEIIEWIGFAIFINHTASWMFVLWTCANLVPRALSAHKWYKKQFKEYNNLNRRAIFPFIL